MTTITIGASDYDVYSDVAAADEYYNASTEFSDWDAFTDPEKSRGLVSATRLLDRQQWQGEKETTSPTTDLTFPRTGLTTCSGDTVTSAESLVIITETTQLLALDLLSGETVDSSRSTEDLTKRLKAGSVEIENFRADKESFSRFPLDVMELIGCFLASNVTIAGSIATGTDGVAADIDFDVTRAF